MNEQAQSPRPAQGLRIGLTGGIGCGKSTAAKFFGAEGFRILDVDELVRTKVLVEPEVVAEASRRWGKGVIRTDGALDRGRVAEIVFGDAAERVWWEGVVHPRVGRRWRAELAADLGADWVVEVPLLFEAGLEKEFDFVVCVAANTSAQMNRAVERGLPPAQVERRIASQLPLATKLKSAHFVLWNEGSREFLARQIRDLTGRLRKTTA
jgi:dephospho-CoA kinase